MRALLTLPLVLALFLSPDRSMASLSDPSVASDALVAIHVAGLTDAMVARFAKECAGQKNISIEYTCTWSGIMVVKFMDIAAGDRADVITYARRILADAGIERGVEFLHVHSASGGSTGKC